MSKNQEERQTSQCQLKQAEDDDIIWTPIGIFSKSEHQRRNSLQTSTSPIERKGRKSVCQGKIKYKNLYKIELIKI